MTINQFKDALYYKLVERKVLNEDDTYDQFMKSAEEFNDIFAVFGEIVTAEVERELAIIAEANKEDDVDE